MKHKLKTWFIFVTCIVALMAVTFATYAWFTINRKVSTSTATARTGEESLELQISSNGGSDFKNSSPAKIQQVNKTDLNWLMPVSTADLKSFVYSPVTIDGMAKSFELVSDESNYYHGRIYLCAKGEGMPEGSKVDLYLDESRGILGNDVDEMLLNAARLGLSFDNGSSGNVILRLSDKSNPNNQQVYNTVINGEVLGDDQVLSYGRNGVKAAKDPSSLVDDYLISFGDNTAEVPDKPLLEMEIGRIYQLDIYFYLEGCDPDCSDSISFDVADIHLAFYGMLSKEGR